MLSGLFSGAVLIYAFYAMQPYLLELYGNRAAYGVAGLAAAIVAGAQILGGLLVPHLGRVFRRRTSVLLGSTIVSAIALVGIGLFPRFWIVIALLVVWGLLFAATTPVHQAYVNGLIPSEQRATVLSFDNLLASTGGVASQPLLGRAADVWGYPASYLCCGAIQALGIPFSILARRENARQIRSKTLAILRTSKRLRRARILSGPARRSFDWQAWLDNRHATARCYSGQNVRRPPCM
jgi:MFS family permease